jgi:hypothetical protein
MSTNLIDAARDPVPVPQFTTHVIDLTDDNIVVDLTPWNRLHPNNLPFIRLDDHPFKAAIRRSIEDLKRSRLFDRPLPFDPDASFVYFPKLLPGKTGIPDLPLDLAWLDPKRLLTAALGFRETETQICAQFSVKHYLFGRSDGCPETPQSFNIEINTDENEILQNRVWLQRALLTGDPDRMLNMLISLFKGFFFFNSSPSFRGPDESVRIYYFTKKYLRFVALMMLNFSNAEDRRGEVHPAISPLGM